MRDHDIHKKSKEELLKMLFQSFVVGIRNFRATSPRAWLESKGLSYDDLQIGFCSGQFAHRQSDEFKKRFMEIGVLVPSKAPVREPQLKAYTVFGSYGIVFPLKNEKGEMVNLFAIRIEVKKDRTEYLNQDGLYPGYPAPFTKRLFITSTVLDAASLLQSKVMENRDAVLSLFDGELKEQHIQAIKGLNHLEEIIFIK
jgi:hypothetical protein